MRTVFKDMKLWKVEIDATGKLEIVIFGNGQKYSATLTAAELEQLCFRVTEATKGAVSFDPLPQDLVNRHEEDKRTLEEQNATIVSLREEISELLKAPPVPTEVGETIPASLEPEDEKKSSNPPDYDSEVAKIEAARQKAKERQLEIAAAPDNFDDSDEESHYVSSGART